MTADQPTQAFNAAQAEADATARLRDFIARSAGQNRRAIARGFAEARDQLESTGRHHQALAHSTTQPGASA